MSGATDCPDIFAGYARLCAQPVASRGGWPTSPSAAQVKGKVDAGAVKEAAARETEAIAARLAANKQADAGGCALMKEVSARYPPAVAEVPQDPGSSGAAPSSLSAEARFVEAPAHPMSPAPQLELFAPSPASPPSPSGRRSRQPRHPSRTRCRRCGARLPTDLRLGTSSWSFPGWTGLVYAREAGPEMLARQGLPAYARHPLLRTVGVDRTFYGPVPAETFAAWAAAVPEDFRFR